MNLVYRSVLLLILTTDLNISFSLNEKCFQHRLKSTIAFDRLGVNRGLMGDKIRAVKRNSEVSNHLNLKEWIGLNAKNIVSSLAISYLLLNKSWDPIYFVLCGLLNGGLAKLLKSVLKQPRPFRSRIQGYGMPSSHAQVIFYFLTVISLYCLNLEQKIIAIPPLGLLYYFSFAAT